MAGARLLRPPALARWWQELLGGELRQDDDGFVSLKGGPLEMLFLAVPEAKVVKNRLHFDHRTTDYEAAVARAIALGATPADEIYVGERWRVLRDPEGNGFCIIPHRRHGVFRTCGPQASGARRAGSTDICCQRRSADHAGRSLLLADERVSRNSVAWRSEATSCQKAP